MKSKIFVLLLTWTFGGCGDFLEEQSLSEIRPSTVRDMEKILEGEAYFSPENGYILNRGTDIFTDDVCCNVVNNQYAPVKEKGRYRFTWDKTMFDEAGGGVDVSFWQGPYEQIKGCNVVLDYIDDMDGDVAKRDHLKGEAYVLRGFYYLMLVNFFGMPYNYDDPTKNPGVPLKLTSGVTDERFARNSVAECYRQIEADLLNGTRLLTANKDEKSLKMTRLNYLAGYALLSRLYLYMEDWEKAYRYADSVLMDKPDLIDLRSVSTGGVYYSTTPEEILWAGIEEYNKYNVGMKYPFSVSTDLSSLFLRDVNDGEIDIRGDYDNVDWMEVTISPVFLKRGRQWVTTAYEYWVAVILKGNSTGEGYCFYSGGARTAEMYLNRAEVSVRRYIQTGNREDGERALRDLNALRSKRFKEGYADKVLSDFSSGEELLEFCLRERRRELCGEGNHRWFDLRRLGMPELKHVFVDDDNGFETPYTLPENDSRYALPIPEEVIRKNPSLALNY